MKADRILKEVRPGILILSMKWPMKMPFPEFPLGYISEWIVIRG
jgi:hypothetical protein